MNIASFPRDTPHTTSYNPYLQLFFSALEPYGIHVRKEAAFNRYYVLEHNTEIDAIWLHWLHMFRSIDTAEFMDMLALFKQLNIPLIWTCHNFLPHENVTEKDRILQQAVIQNADLIIVHSESSRQQLETVKNIVVMQHGTYTDYFPNFCTREEARKKLGIADDRQVFLYFGMLRKYKEVERLIEAFLSLNDDSLLCIVGQSLEGDSYYREILAPLMTMSDHIMYFDGAVPVDVQVFFNAADVIVYPFDKVTSSGSFLMPFTFPHPVIIKESTLARELFHSIDVLWFTTNDELVAALKKSSLIDAVVVKQQLLQKASRLAWSETVKEAAKSILALHHD